MVHIYLILIHNTVHKVSNKGMVDCREGFIGFKFLDFTLQFLQKKYPIHKNIFRGTRKKVHLALNKFFFGI